MVDLISPTFGLLIGSFVIGSVYCLMAMGLSMLWSTVGLANFAHGSILVVGSYAAWAFFAATNATLSFLGVVPTLFLFGLVCDRILFRKVRYVPDAPLRLMLITFTLAIMLEQILNLVFGGQGKRLPDLVAGRLNLGDASIAYSQFLTFGVSVSVLVALLLFLGRTRLGLAIRAVGQQIEEARIAGVDVDKIYAVTVGIGFVLAGVAGILLGSTYVFNTTFGRAPLLIGYIIVVLGGLGNIKGTIISSFLVASIQSLTAFFIGGAWTIAVPFLTMIAILLLRPQGLFGKKGEAS